MLRAAVRVSLHIRIHNGILQNQKQLKPLVCPKKIHQCILWKAGLYGVLSALSNSFIDVLLHSDNLNFIDTTYRKIMLF
jgi:hypothetical protein